MCIFSKQQTETTGSNFTCKRLKVKKKKIATVRYFTWKWSVEKVLTIVLQLHSLAKMRHCEDDVGDNLWYDGILGVLFSLSMLSAMPLCPCFKKKRLVRVCYTQFVWILLSFLVLDLVLRANMLLFRGQKHTNESWSCRNIHEQKVKFSSFLCGSAHLQKPLCISLETNKQTKTCLFRFVTLHQQ